MLPSKNKGVTYLLERNISCHIHVEDITRWLEDMNYSSGAPAARRATKWSPIPIQETKDNPWSDFLMVIMASGIARGRVCMMTTTTVVESRKIVVLLQRIGWQGHKALVYRVPLWHWTFMLWSIDTCQNKVSADQYHVTISRAQVYNSSRSRVFWSWPLTKCWLSIGSRAHVGLTFFSLILQYT